MKHSLHAIFSFILIAALSGWVTELRAQQEVIEYVIKVPNPTTPFGATFTFPAFDPTIGRLEKVEMIDASPVLSISAGAPQEENDPIDGTVFLQVSVETDIEGRSGSTCFDKSRQRFEPLVTAPLVGNGPLRTGLYGEIASQNNCADADSVTQESNLGTYEYSLCIEGGVNDTVTLTDVNCLDEVKCCPSAPGCPQAIQYFMKVRLFWGTSTDLGITLSGSQVTKYAATIVVRYTYTPAEQIPDYDPTYPGCTILGNDLESFNGHADGQDNVIEWIYDDPQNVEFQVERRDMFSDWEILTGSVSSEPLGDKRVQFNQRDDLVPQGENFYRLMYKTIGGNVSSSEIISVVNPAPREVKVLAYPNPTTNGEINIQLEGFSEFPVKVSIMNLEGQSLIVARTESPTFTLKAPNIGQGMYILVAESNQDIAHAKIQVHQDN